MIILAGAFIFFWTGFCSAENLKIKMLNVGQGDAILIQTDSENILVDTSDVDERDKLIRELYKADVSKIDKIILTHPHADHIGNAAYLIKLGTVSVNSVYDNGVVSTSKYYVNYLAECKNRNVIHNTLKSGDKIPLDDGAYLEIFSPTVETVSLVNGGNKKTDPNNESIVGRLVYKNFSMLFTGDAEHIAEAEILKRGATVKSKILKAGHHGAASANSLNFVKAVNPEYVLISAGTPTNKRGGNTYGHPRAEALNAFLGAGVKYENIFCTAQNGTVTVDTDGETFSVTPELQTDWLADYLNGKNKTVTSVTKLF